MVDGQREERRRARRPDRTHDGRGELRDAVGRSKRPLVWSGAGYVDEDTS